MAVDKCLNLLKVPAKVDELCVLLQEKQKTVGTFREQYELSFNAHLNLVIIHPWVDGNGRTARLLMNYIQFYYHLFLLRYSKRIGKNISFLCANVKTKKPTNLSWTLWQDSWRNRFLWRLKGSVLLRRKGSVLCFRGIRTCRLSWQSAMVAWNLWRRFLQSCTWTRKHRIYTLQSYRLWRENAENQTAAGRKKKYRKKNTAWAVSFNGIDSWFQREKLSVSPWETPGFHRLPRAVAEFEPARNMKSCQGAPGSARCIMWWNVTDKLPFPVSATGICHGLYSCQTIE